jgi:hypothetical protein
MHIEERKVYEIDDAYWNQLVAEGYSESEILEAAMANDKASLKWIKTERSTS